MIATPKRLLVQTEDLRSPDAIHVAQDILAHWPPATEEETVARLASLEDPNDQIAVADWLRSRMHLHFRELGLLTYLAKQQSTAELRNPHRNEEFLHGVGELVESVPSAVDRVEMLSRWLLEDEDWIDFLRQLRDQAIMDALAEGASAYAVAKKIGMSKTKVQKVRHSYLRELHQLEPRLAHTAVASYVAGTHTDEFTEDRCTYVSPAFATMLGRTQSELKALHPSQYVHPDDIATVVEPRVQAVAAGFGTYVFIVRLAHGSGRWVRARVVTRIVSDPDSGTIHSLVTFEALDEE